MRIRQNYNTMNLKMKSKDKKRVFLGLLIIFAFQFIIPNIAGVQRDATISTVAEKDSYVELGDAISNFGGKDWLIFGDYYVGFNEAYLYFNFSNKPADWSKAEISIDMYSISETFNVTASLINDTWNELTINYINKPAHGEVITTFTVAEEKVYKIDVSNYIVGREYISICFNASDYLQRGYVQARSKEGSYSWSPGPQLVWTYPEDATIAVTNPTSSTSWSEINFYTIRWTTSTNSITNVKIELYKGNTLVEEITSIFGYTTNDGEYDFYVSSSEDYEGNNYRIKISDYDDPQVYDFSPLFSINVDTSWSEYFSFVNDYLPLIIGIIFGSITLIAIFYSFYRLRC